MVDYRRADEFARAVVRQARKRNVPFMAGSIAYQAFVSLVPLLVLLVFLLSFVDNASVSGTVVAVASRFLPREAVSLLAETIAGRTKSVGASIIGIVTLVWGALKIFRGLDTAFAEIYETPAGDSLLDQLKDGVVVLVALGGALLASTVATAVMALLPLPSLSALSPLLLVAGLVVAFFPMYWRFPDVDASLSETLPGVVVAAVGWSLLQTLFGLYVQYISGRSAATGVGAVLLLLTWLYLGCLVLLVGATVNAVAVGAHAATDEDVDATAGREREGTEPADGSADGPEGTPQSDRAAAEEEEQEEGEGDAPAESVREQNRRLRAAVRWYRRPLWARLYDRVRGERPPVSEEELP